jgi:hypothetical protein
MHLLKVLFIFRLPLYCNLHDFDFVMYGILYIILSIIIYCLNPISEYIIAIFDAICGGYTLVRANTSPRCKASFLIHWFGSP